MRLGLAAIVVGLGLAGGAPAQAQVAQVEEQRQVVSATFSPIHLFMPVVEVTGEVRVLPKLGVAGILGYGRMTDKNDRDYTVWELGGQGAWYLFGDFHHGMQLGLEALYLGVSDQLVDAKGEGFAVGPFVGYKLVTRLGFTFLAQLGVEGVFARSSGDATADDSAMEVLPLLNLNLGWSF